jgi:ketosteroid isomerase-like protein
MITLFMVATFALVAEGTDAEASKAVRAVLDAQVAAWNKGDLEQFMNGYWRSPDLSFASGAEVTRGWDATLARYKRKYRSEGAEMGKLAFSELEIDPLGSDAVLVRGHWQLTRSKDKPGGVFTLIFRKLPAGWRIVHDHTSGS